MDELFAEGFEAVFLGTGAGLPHLMHIPGENLVGVYTANEFLTRLNLMEAFRFPETDTPVHIGKRTVVVGGGNSAMDAARWARRMGSETTIMFRRGRAELRARLEEIEHAEEEGVHFEFLAAPVRLFGDEKGTLSEMECIRMKLGEPDESGRPSPVPMEGSEYRIPVDTVVMAIGQSPNPTVQRSTPQLVTNRGKITVDTQGQTSMARVFAGGDVVRGGSTVILAMRDGRAAAAAIHEALKDQQSGTATAVEPGFSPAPADARAAVVSDHQTKVENRILAKRLITPEIAWFEVQATGIARHWQAGQFVILRPRADSERIPLTLVDGDPEKGTITLVVQGHRARPAASWWRWSPAKSWPICSVRLGRRRQLKMLGTWCASPEAWAWRSCCPWRALSARPAIASRLCAERARRRRSFSTRNSAPHVMKSSGPPTMARRE